MLILLDEDLPRRLRRRFPQHLVRTVQQQGWTGVRNGELLRRAAAAGFEFFLTADQNLAFQQNLSGSSLCVLVLVARSNKEEDLVPLLPALLHALEFPQPGTVRVVRAP